jgi:hypothetical protein
MRVLVASVPAGTLFAGALALFLRGKALTYPLQLLGAGCLVVFVLAHICEAFHLFPSMEWGLERSAGHYLDLVSASRAHNVSLRLFASHSHLKRSQ